MNLINPPTYQKPRQPLKTKGQTGDAQKPHKNAEV